MNLNNNFFNDSRTIASELTQIYIYVLITAYLLLTGLHGYRTIAVFKSNAFLMLGGLYCITMLIFSIHKKTYKRKYSIVQICVLAYLAFSWISWSLSDYRHASFFGATRTEGIITITIYCLSFIFISLYGKIDKYIQYILATVMLIFCIIIILQLLGLNPFYLYPDGLNYFDKNELYSGEFIGTIGNADHVSAFLAPVSLTIIILAINQKSKAKIIDSIVGLVGIIVLFRISVLSGIVGFILGFLFVLPVAINVSKKERKKLYIAIIVLLIATLIIIFFFDINIDMLHEMHQLLHGNFDPTFGTGRIKIWTEVLKRIPGHLLFGHGPDTLIFAEIEPWSRFIESINTQITTTIDVAHNEYLNVLYSQGLFACLSFCGIIVFSIARTMFNKRELNLIQLALLGYVMVYAIQAFFNISVCLVSIYFWLALGLLEHENNIQPQK